MSDLSDWVSSKSSSCKLLLPILRRLRSEDFDLILRGVTDSSGVEMDREGGAGGDGGGEACDVDGDVSVAGSEG